jgi:hypothetical protein
LGVLLRSFTQPCQPSPKGLSGRPAHRPFRGLYAHSSDGDQWFQAIVITVSSDRDQAQHELFTVLSIGAAAEHN